MQFVNLKKKTSASSGWEIFSFRITSPRILRQVGRVQILRSWYFFTTWLLDRTSVTLFRMLIDRTFHTHTCAATKMNRNDALAISAALPARQSLFQTNI